MKIVLLAALLLISSGSLLAQGASPDTMFEQEYHEAYPVSEPIDPNVRSISVMPNGTVLIATASGAYQMQKGSRQWKSLQSNANEGPAYAVLSGLDNVAWVGTWNGLYRLNAEGLQAIPGISSPISVITEAPEGLYAGGPGGIWLINKKGLTRMSYPVSRSIRRMRSDGAGGLWLATDVGLYHCTGTSTEYQFETDQLPSAYVKDIAYDRQRRLWATCLGGIELFDSGKPVKRLGVTEGCPTIYLNSIAAANDGSMWVGTQLGLVRFHPNGTHTLRFSRRWLLDDNVNDIAFDSDGWAWIATSKGVSVIRKRSMTLALKSDYFYDVLMKRHIRAPWIAGQCHLKIPGDLNSWQPEDDDNDGEFTGNYLAMESFRYAASKNPDAREKAKKAFHFLKLLEEVTGGDGYFARSIIPVDWTNRVHDTNRTYTPQQLADELVKEPRYKPVEKRWRPSADGRWLWKGDASSDEWCGHMLGYYFYYELAADKEEKILVSRHVQRLVDHLIANNFNMMDIDGTHTRWSVWSPDKLNRDPEWRPDRYQNSMELLSFLKLAYYMSGDAKYQQHYTRLIREEGYLENMKKLTLQNPAWFIYYDVTMQAYLFPILLHCEKDPQLLETYKSILETWMDKRKEDHNPLINFLYCYATGRQVELKNSVDFLQDTPLDLIDWVIDHTRREDINLVRSPVLDDLQVSELPPPSIRAAVRWDKNPWDALDGSPDMEREPVFWLFPYWMGKYLKMIE